MTAPEPAYEYDDDEDLAALEPPEGSPVDEILEWHLHRLARAHARLTGLAGERDRMVARYQRWYDTAAAPLAAQIDRDETAVRMMILARVAADPKAAKTLHLPSGTVATRKGQTVVEVADEALFVEWAVAAERPGLLRFPPAPAPKPDRAAIKEAYTDGEFLPEGLVRLVEHDRTVTIDLDTDRAEP